MLTFLYTLWILYTVGTLSIILTVLLMGLYSRKETKKRLQEFHKRCEESKETSNNLKEESW